MNLNPCKCGEKLPVLDGRCIYCPDPDCYRSVYGGNANETIRIWNLCNPIKPKPQSKRKAKR
jgi:hypothetical protein